MGDSEGAPPSGNPGPLSGPGKPYPNPSQPPTTCDEPEPDEEAGDE